MGFVDSRAADVSSDSLSSFSVADNLSLTTAVAEPEIGQPVYLTFDERGRMWVVQYLQFPFPAGLKVIGHDEYWRVKYDRFPPPAPPNHVRGADKITILSDSDGDGRFEKEKDFVTGLNICTAALPGRGGVWVMNPPYLLFYPDSNRDDVPDGDPVVHLEGFGMEDMHAVANSLTWGPDGWLYGCQGSTCTATVKRPGLDKEGIRFKGQCIWRYDPETRRFELFAEGGYNNFGIAFDNKFRLFTGSNGGIIGVHYVQHAYYRKIWGKHGPLTNPYALGWIDGMPDQSSRAKLSQAMIVYEADALPESYQGQMIVARIMQRRIDLCELTPAGSTYSAREVKPILSSAENFFRPVDLKVGPDGAVYIADWNEDNVTWNVTAEGHGVHRNTGRIYRLASKGAPHYRPFDLGRSSSSELIELLSDRNIWRRQMAIRLLWDRRDPAVANALARRSKESSGQAALDMLWAATASRSFTPEFAASQLKHSDPYVRLWTVRLIGDEAVSSSEIREELLTMAVREVHPQVRSQLACTAKTLAAPVSLEIIRALAWREEDERDQHLPLLLWWALEAQLKADPEKVFSWLEEKSLWSAPLFQSALASRLGERFTIDRTKANLDICARLLDLAPNANAVSQLISGMVRGLAGTKVDRVPERLELKLSDLQRTHGSNSEFVLLGLRLGQRDAVAAASAVVRDSSANEKQRLEFLRLLAETGESSVAAPALELLQSKQSTALRTGALEALQRIGSEQVGETIVDVLPAMEKPLQAKALTILASRPSWARLVVETIEQKRLAPRLVPLDIVASLRSSTDSELRERARRIWGTGESSSAEKRDRIQTLKAAVGRGKGDAKAGQALFGQLCSSCHIMFGNGGRIGPELTGIDRQNTEYLLRAIVDPSEVILPEYQGWRINLKQAIGDSDEQMVTGLVELDSPNTITLLNAAGTALVIPKSNITGKEPMSLSIMPEGLIDALSKEQVADLLRYLQSESGPAPAGASGP